MAFDTDSFGSSYGPWAVVTGGSDGLGAEFASQLAAAGLNLVLVARRADVLERLAADLRGRHGVETLTVALDVSEQASLEKILRDTEAMDVGLLVCNAAASPLGPFLDELPAVHRQLIDLNCRAPALLAWEMGRRMASRGRGGIILVSSMAGFQGTGHVVHYAASKAYLRVLAEGLWDELRAKGVHPLACCPGLVRTPTFLRGGPVRPAWLASPLMDPAPVVREALRALGRKPVVVPGRANRAALWITEHLMARRQRITLASRGTRAMYRA
jgi:short-subunit dehydrogenase